MSPAPSFRFTRAQRIRTRPEFVRIQASPSRVTTRHLLLLLEARPDAGPARLGVVASRKVGPSVHRSRAKRLVREAFRLHPELFPAGLDAVVVVRPGVHGLGLADLEAELVKAGPLLARRAAELRRARSGLDGDLRDR
jgi:ribonuclease P protein component